MEYWVYIVTNRPGGTLYVGVTNDLVRRAFEHRKGLVAGFSKRYGLKRLVYHESHDTPIGAIQREEHQALAKGMEGRPHRLVECAVARPLR